MRISVIGGGNLGSAIVEGFVSGKIVDAKDITVSALSGKTLQKFTTFNANINVTTSNIKAIADADIVIVAVKPKVIDEVLQEIAPSIDRDRQTVVSAAAGVSLERLAASLALPGSRDIQLLRMITNTAISVGKAVTLITPHSNTAAGNIATVERLFSGVGAVWKVEEEMLSPLTALSSCGMAYALKYIEATTAAGVEAGIGDELAHTVAMQTVEGALAMLESHRSRPADEIERVATKGGITRKGLEAMDEAGFSEAVLRGLKASL